MIPIENKFICPPIKDEKKHWVRSNALKLAQVKYYNKNKAKIVAEQLKYNLSYVKQKYTCECGDTLQLSGKYLHTRSNRHKDRLAMIGNGIDPNIMTKNKTFECECGSKLLNKNKNAHLKSKKHLDYVKETFKIEMKKPDVSIRII